MKYKNNIEILNSILKKIKDASSMTNQNAKTEFAVMVLMNLGAHQNIFNNEFYAKKEITKEEHEKLSANIEFLKNQCLKLFGQQNLLQKTA